MNRTQRWLLFGVSVVTPFTMGAWPSGPGLTRGVPSVNKTGSWREFPANIELFIELFSNLYQPTLLPIYTCFASFIPRVTSETVCYFQSLRFLTFRDEN